MAHATDHDRKSKTSTIDHKHHLEQNEVDRAEIAELANELWRSHGCPDGSDQQDWFEAEEELRARKLAEHPQH